MIYILSKTLALSLLWSLFLTGPKAAFGRKVYLVNVLYRHGDRSPTQTYPNSVYPEDTWPQGYGELSRRGIQMQYDLGQYLRDRYKLLLDTRYSRYEIYVRSTDLNRTLMSAQANLAGLYPPTSDDQIWNPNILWQPIPVHTEPRKEDYLLRMNGVPCPKYDALQKKTVEHDPEYLKLNEDYKEFLGYVSKKAGYETNLTVIDIWKLHDPLHVEKLHNFTLPVWATNDTMQKLKHLSDLGMYYEYNTKAKSRLKAGHLVGQMISNMIYSQSTMEPRNKTKKMFMYSAHDTTLSAFMSVLGVFNKEQPPLASCIGVDFIQEDESSQQKYTVEMWFHNDSKGDPYKLTLPGCESPCPLQDFINLTQDIVPKDIVKECGAESHDLSLSLIILIVIVVIVLAAVIVGLLCILVCRHRPREPRHTRLPSEDPTT